MDYEKVCDILLCPICTEIALPPIFQCQRGHILCHECIPKVGHGLCPTCRTPMPSDKIRALALEQLANSLELKCKHWSKGCCTTHSLQNINSHLLDCIYEGDNLCQLFGSVSCKGVTCLPDFHEHCKTFHSESTRVLELNNVESSLLSITQSVLLGDLYNNSNIVWEPFYIVFGTEVNVILPKYVGSQKHFQWTLVTLGLAAVSKQNTSASSHRLKIVRKVDLDPQSDEGITWNGKSQEFVKFKENCKKLEVEKFSWDPKIICSIPLEYFIDCSKSHTAVDLTNLCRIEFSLQITWNRSLVEKKLPVTKFHPFGTNVSSQIFRQLVQDQPLTSIELHSYHKLEHDLIKEMPTEKLANVQVFNLICDRCDMAIVGTAYSCTICPGFDLCDPCTQSGAHSEHILIRKKFSELQAVAENDEFSQGQRTGYHGNGNIFCDACGSRIRGVRFKCCLCQDLDICESCEGKNFHDFHWCLRTSMGFNDAALHHAIFVVRRNNGLQSF